MIQEILTYKNIVNSVDDLMAKSHYKKGYIIEQIGITAPTFYRKLAAKSFTADEMLQIAKILNPEEFYRIEFLRELNEAKKDFSEGRVRTHQEAMLEIKKRKKLANI